VYAQAALVGGFLPLRPPRETPRSALGNLYRTRDDRWILLSLPMEEVTWPRFAQAIEKPDLLSDPRFAETPARRANAAALTAILDTVFATAPLADWLRRLKAARLTFSPINRIEDIATDEQAVACGAVIETADPEMPRTLAAPFQLRSTRPRPAGKAPGLGEHTDEVLREAGLSAAEIAAVRRAGGAA
jgi:formyl-CoA transferase